MTTHTTKQKLYTLLMASSVMSNKLFRNLFKQRAITAAKYLDMALQFVVGKSAMIGHGLGFKGRKKKTATIR